MNISFNETEKWLKRALKNRVKVEQKTIIAYLMMGIIGLGLSTRVEAAIITATREDFVTKTNGTEATQEIYIKMDDNSNALAIGGASGTMTNGTPTHAATADTGGVAIGSTTTAGNGSTAIGFNSNASGGNAVAIGYSLAATGGAAIGIGLNAKSTALETVAIGRDANASGKQSLSLGSYSSSAGTQSIAMGQQSKAEKDAAIAIGLNTTASDKYAVALGFQAGASNESGIAIGDTAKSLDSRAVAIGMISKAEGINSVALGAGANSTSAAQAGVAVGAKAQATAVSSMALGTKAVASIDKSVALGEGATTTAAVATKQATVNGISYGNFAGDAPVSVVSVGSKGNERQIQNVAAGQISTTSTDAINGSQLYMVTNHITENSPFEYVDKDGKPVVKIGDKFYPAGTVTDATGKPVNADGNAVNPIDDQNNVVIKAKATNPENITNVAGNLTPTYNVGDSKVDSSTGKLNDNEKADTATKEQTAPTNVSSIYNNAATVGDVLNAGWNLQGNGEAKDFVKPYDTVNFADGKGTTVDVTTDAAGKTSTIKVNVTKGVLTNDADGKVIGITEKEKEEIKKAIDDAKAQVTAAEQALASADDSTKAEKQKELEAAKKVLEKANAAEDNALNQVATIENVAEAINKSGWNVTSGTEGTGESTTDSKTTKELINPGETVTLKAGDNLKIKQDGNNFTYSLNPELKDLKSVEVKDGNNTTIVKPGVIEGLTTTLTDNSANSSGTAPNNPTTTNAATLGDVLNAGWNLQVEGKAADFVKPYDTVNFAAKSGSGITVTEKDDSTNDKTTVEIGLDLTKATELTTELEEHGDGLVLAKDENKLVNAGDIANAINNSGWNVTAGEGVDEGKVTGAEKTLVKSGDKVTFDAGKNMELLQEKTKFTYSLSSVLTDLESAEFNDPNSANTTTINGAGLSTSDGTNTTTVGPTTITVGDKTGTNDKPVTIKSGDNGGTISNLAGNLPQVNDTDKTIYNPVDGTTTAANDANITKAPITAAEAANIVKNSGSNAATIGDVLNAGWNLQGNGTAVDFVKPYDTVNFINGAGTTVVTDTDGTTSSIKINTLVAVTDKDGNTLVQANDGKWYKAADVVNGTPKAGATAIEAADTVVNVINPSAPANTKGDAVKLGNVTSGLSTYTDADKPTTGATGLVNLNNKDIPDTNVATVGDLRNMGWVVATPGNSFEKPVKNAYKVNFKGDGVNVEGEVDAATNTYNVNFSIPEAGRLKLKQLIEAAGTGQTEADVTGAVAIKDNPGGFTSAQTVMDAINGSGWNLQENGTQLGLINPADKINFVNGTGTKVTITPTKEDTKLTAADIKVDIDTVKLETNGDGTVKEVTDSNKIATAQDVANTINKSGWNATSGTGVNGGEVTGTTKELVNPGETVTFDAGKNMKLVQEGNKFTYATKDDVEFTTVTTKDAAGNTTVINGEGVTITPKDGEKVSLTKDGLDNGGNKITNVAAGDISENSTDAINGSQLYQVTNEIKSEISNLGWNAEGGATGTGVVNNTSKEKVANGDTVKLVAGNNLILDQNGKEFTFSLNKELNDINNISVGKDGKDGVDGTIGVNGKDGSSVVINGKDGSIGAKGTDGASVTINGKDGTIGLTGPKGTDGKDGANATLSVKDGSKGLDGNNGKDGESKTRIAYETKNPDGTTNTEEVATLNDGLLFTGNNEKVNTHKLNSKVTIKGEGVDKATSEKFVSAAGNINVKADGGDTLEVQLAKDIKGLSTIETKDEAGNTTVTNGEGLTITPKDGEKVSITKDGLNNGGNKITNVAAGKDGTDGVNVSQLRGMEQNINNRIDDLDHSTRRGIAGAMAQAGVKFQEQGVNQVVVGAAASFYRGQGAVAVGVQGAPTENTRVHTTVSATPGRNTNAAITVGGSWKFNIK